MINGLRKKFSREEVDTGFKLFSYQTRIQEEL